MENLRFTRETDVWSYGVTLTELFNVGIVPYSNLDNHKVITAVLGGHTIQKPADCPTPFYDEIISPCWSLDPAKRPSFQKILDAFDHAPPMVALFRKNPKIVMDHFNLITMSFATGTGGAVGGGSGGGEVHAPHGADGDCVQSIGPVGDSEYTTRGGGFDGGGGGGGGGDGDGMHSYVKFGINTDTAGCKSATLPPIEHAGLGAVGRPASPPTTTAASTAAAGAGARKPRFVTRNTGKVVPAGCRDLSSV